jgi:hypothetical protein
MGKFDTIAFADFPEPKRARLGHTLHDYFRRALSTEPSEAEDQADITILTQAPPVCKQRSESSDQKRLHVSLRSRVSLGVGAMDYRLMP